MTVLLDTHTLLWSIYAPSKLSPHASAIVSDPLSQLLVSAATAWEDATKVRIGKMPHAERLERNFLDAMRNGGYALRSITTEDALRAARLVGSHKDPFDRMIAAQALGDDIAILSSDTKLDLFQVRRIW